MKTVIAISKKMGVWAVYAIGLAIVMLQFRSMLG